jgi:RimJ/RimL family protein N-acetyltransferase
VNLLPEQIGTPRLHLRPPVPADAAAMLDGWCQDPVVCRFMAWPPHRSVADTRAFVADCLAGWRTGMPLVWAITDRDADAPIGTIEARPAGTTVSLGYVLRRARWGAGLMAEAVTAVTGASLALPGIFRVQAVCDTENIPSARVLEKAGFTREGRLARYGVHPNIGPEPRDVYLYARVRSP